MKPKKQIPQNKKSGLMLDPKDHQGRLRFIGGSASDHWNGILVNQATSSLWSAHSEEEERDRQRSATVVALASIRPKDELEGMIAAQLLAAHNATMECYRRAMLPQQSSDGRSENLNQANKLCRTYVVLLDALNRHRGKGQQKVTVEHVHVHSGGQVVVGMVGPGGVGAHPKLEDQPQAKQIAYAPQPPVERGQSKGAGASRPRCRTAGVDCTAESRRALPKGTRTRSSTAAIRPRRLRPGGRLPRCCGP
jgi:hypothetical protein